MGNIDNSVGMVGVNGSVQVSPTTTTTYTFTATGPGGTATAKATVTVNPAPIVTATLSASPAAMFPGLSSILTFTSTNANTGTINGNAVGSNGSIQVSPATTTTYTFTASGPDGTASAMAAVTIFAGNSFPGMNAQEVTNLTEDIDPNGAVGTKQFMEYVNSAYQAFDKSGPNYTTVWPNPQPIGTPWLNPANGGTIAQCAGTNNITLDAVINFDRLASRWVVAAKSTGTDGNYYFCIAVSNVDDLSSPTLGWFAYVFPLDAVLGQDAGGTTYLRIGQSWAPGPMPTMRPWICLTFPARRKLA